MPYIHLRVSVPSLSRLESQVARYEWSMNHVRNAYDPRKAGAKQEAADVARDWKLN